MTRTCRPLLLAFASLLLTLSSCSGGGGAGSALQPYPIAHPVLDTFEPVVQEQLSSEKQVLADAVAQAEGASAGLGGSYGRLGTFYHAYGLRAAAMDCYRNAAELDPTNFRWPYFLGVLLGYEGEDVESAEALEHARELGPDYLPIRVHLARIKLEQGDTARAEALVDGVLERDRDNALALVEKGRILLARGDHAGALRNLEAVKELYPDVTAFDYELGLAYRGLGQMEKARGYMTRRDDVRRSLGDPLFQQINQLRRGGRAHLSAGTVAFGSGHYDLAEKHFRDALAVDPDQAGTHLNLGATLIQLERLDEALVEMRAAVRLDPGSARSQFGLGTLLAQLGEEEQALAHLATAVELDPESRDAAQNYVNALRRAGRFEEALPLCRGIIQREPGHEPARLGEVYTLLALGRHGEAHTRADEGVAALPDSAELRHVLARLLAASPVEASRDGARALQLARQLHALNPEKIEFNETMAMALAETGDLHQAVGHQLQALETAKRIGLADLGFLQGNLDRYRRGEPCRVPFDPEGSELRPQRAKR